MFLLTLTKKKTDVEKEAVQLNYKQTGRARKFLPSKMTRLVDSQKRLEDNANGTTCNICKPFENIRSFVVGCTHYGKSTISSHEKSDSHLMNVKIKALQALHDAPPLR